MGDDFGYYTGTNYSVQHYQVHKQVDATWSVDCEPTICSTISRRSTGSSVGTCLRLSTATTSSSLANWIPPWSDTRSGVSHEIEFRSARQFVFSLSRTTIPSTIPCTAFTAAAACGLITRLRLSDQFPPPQPPPPPPHLFLSFFFFFLPGRLYRQG